MNRAEANDAQVRRDPVECGGVVYDHIEGLIRRRDYERNEFYYELLLEDKNGRSRTVAAMEMASVMKENAGVDPA